MDNNHNRYVSEHPAPSGYENELLDHLIEECAEVIQRVTKAKRFGLAEVQEGQTLTNAERIAMEAGNVVAVLDALTDANIFTCEMMNQGYYAKEAGMKKWMQHSPPRDFGLMFVDTAIQENGYA